jgi:hypothetical protein
MVVRTAGAGLRRLADVAVMQATDLIDLDDAPESRAGDRPCVRGVLLQREVSSGAVIVDEVTK